MAALVSLKNVSRRCRALVTKNVAILFVELIAQSGWSFASPAATFYIWAHTPKGFFIYTKRAGKILEEAGVVCTLE